MESAEIRGRVVAVHRSGYEGAPVVYVNAYAGDGTELIEACRGLGCPPFDLVVVSGLDWNADMSPWPCDAVMEGQEGFGGSADAHLRFLEDDVVPYAEGLIGEPSERIIAGYSMAGLFALYAPYRTDLFSRCVSASGSLWFPGFADFVGREDSMRRPDSVYLSLGDREARTRNPVMSRVEDETGKVHGLFSGMGLDTVFELNPGNHFRDTHLRLAKGIAWTLGRIGR